MLKINPASIQPSSLRLYIYFQTLAVILIVWFLAAGCYVDDSYISLRYAKHLLEGYGLTWNPGERVEGYSNFLYILLEAFLGWLGVDLVAASRAINLAAYGLLVSMFAHYLGITHYIGIGKKKDNPSLWDDLAFSLMATSVPVLLWCWQGLEAVLVTMFIFGGVYAVLRMIAKGSTARDALIAGLFFALAFLTRLDSAVFIACSMGFLGFLWLIRQGNIKFSHILVLVAVFSAIAIPYTFWRHAYFGDWLPNTYYAKEYGIYKSLRWGAGLMSFFLYACLPPLLTLFALWFMSWIILKKCSTAIIAYLAMLWIVWLLYMVNVGGDGMPIFRFFVPVIPILILLVYHCGRLLVPEGKSFQDVCLALLFFSALQIGALLNHGDLTLGTISGLAVAPYIETHWPKNSLIAINAVGALPYTDDDYRYIDMLGLTDVHIAHREIAEFHTTNQHAMGHVKGDGAYVLSRQPDYIILGEEWGQDTADYLSDFELLQDPDFKTHYKRVETYVTPPAALLPSLAQIAKAAGKYGAVLNAQNQLRFIYFERMAKKEESTSK